MLALALPCNSKASHKFLGDGAWVDTTLALHQLRVDVRPRLFPCRADVEGTATGGGMQSRSGKVVVVVDGIVNFLSSTSEVIDGNVPVRRDGNAGIAASPKETRKALVDGLRTRVLVLTYSDVLRGTPCADPI